jgi:hypothetical protein
MLGGAIAVPIGRETNYTDQTGILTDPDYTTYPDPGRDQLTVRARAILQAHLARDGHREETAATLGISDRTLRRYLNTGKARPATLKHAAELAATIARTTLQLANPDGVPLPADREGLLYLASRHLALVGWSTCESCGTQLEGRQRRWCAGCRARRSGRNRSRTP